MSALLHYVARVGFEAARRLEQAPAGSPARRVHGHSFTACLRLGAGFAAGAAPGTGVDRARATLRDIVTPLDYQLLNDHLDEPSDENLARWIGSRLDATALPTVAVSGPRDRGVERDPTGAVRGWRRYRFEAAHRLPHVGPHHKCGRLHGHGFAVVLHVACAAGAWDAGGAEALDKLWQPLHEALDHHCLNDIAGLENPTSEHLARWIRERLAPQLPALQWVSVYETATCGAHFDGASFRIWKDFGFDSAVRLASVAAGDPRARVHGHSYRLRLHLAAPLDQVLGWTIDFGDVKERFGPLYERLDHHPLHELPGVAGAGTAALAEWVRGRCGDLLPALCRIDLEETPGCGVVLDWGAAGPALPA